MEAWHREIVELHKFFEGYFLGTIGVDDVERLEAALAIDFTIVGPGGGVSTRAETVAAARGGHGSASQLGITIIGAHPLVDESDVVVARYVERHESADGTTSRLSTVVFTRDPGAPNGLVWRTVHETWLPSEPHR